MTTIPLGAIGHGSNRGFAPLRPSPNLNGVKLKTWASILLFFSGYAPLAVILCVLNFDSEKFEFRNPHTSAATLAVAAISTVLLWLVMRRVHGDVVVKINGVEDKSPELLNYAIPYIVSFVADDVLSDPMKGIAMLLFLLLLCVMSVRTQIVFINPLLTVCGFRLYGVNIETAGTSISRLVISREALEANGELKVCDLGPVLMFGERPFQQGQ